MATTTGGTREAGAAATTTTTATTAATAATAGGAEAAEEEESNEVQAGEACGLTPAQRFRLSDALASIDEEKVAAAYKAWGWSWSGKISEFNLIRVVRELLCIAEDELSDDNVFSLWLLTKQADGFVPVQNLLALGYAA